MVHMEVKIEYKVTVQFPCPGKIKYTTFLAWCTLLALFTVFRIILYLLDVLYLLRGLIVWFFICLAYLILMLTNYLCFSTSTRMYFLKYSQKQNERLFCFFPFARR